MNETLQNTHTHPEVELGQLEQIHWNINKYLETLHIEYLKFLAEMIAGLGTYIGDALVTAYEETKTKTRQEQLITNTVQADDSSYFPRIATITQMPAVMRIKLAKEALGMLSGFIYLPPIYHEVNNFADFLEQAEKKLLSELGFIEEEIDNYLGKLNFRSHHFNGEPHTNLLIQRGMEILAPEILSGTENVIDQLLGLLVVYLPGDYETAWTDIKNTILGRADNLEVPVHLQIAKEKFRGVFNQLSIELSTLLGKDIANRYYAKLTTQKMQRLANKLATALQLVPSAEVFYESVHFKNEFDASEMRIDANSLKQLFRTAVNNGDDSEAELNIAIEAMAFYVGRPWLLEDDAFELLIISVSELSSKLGSEEVEQLQDKLIESREGYLRYRGAEQLVSVMKTDVIERRF